MSSIQNPSENEQIDILDNREDSSIEIINVDDIEVCKTSTKKTSTLSSGAQIYESNDNKKETQNVSEDWERLSQWIYCLCVVTFDLNLGQNMEFVYPVQPTEQEISNICYMAFPDTHNNNCMGDTKFHMRLRISYDGRRRPAYQYCYYNNDSLPILRADLSHYWGFVYFRQKRDSSLPRGYFQKSFIIITRLPFFNLFYEIVGQLAAKFFDEGHEVLKAACRQISQWPLLQAGASLKLQLFDHSYTIFVPRASSRKANLITDSKEGSQAASENCDVDQPVAIKAKVIPSINELELFHSLEFVLDNLYTLWELVLTAEPIVVVGTSPADCSTMVQCLVALIAPLEFCSEYRPYFTIHDSEFKEFTKECGRNPPPVILGVTNPFFVKLLKSWPHMLRLVDKQVNIQQPLHQKSASSSVTSFGSNNNFGASSNSIPFKKSSGLLNASISSSATNSLSSSDGTAPGLYTKYKTFLRKDKSLLKKIHVGIKMKRPEHVQTALIRRNLLELTQSFMIPLERYVASLMPLQKDISPFKSAPNANAFKLDDFLATLELSGPHLTSPLKGDWRGLYRRFFNSPNFRGWYETRHRELQLTLQDLQLQALSEANLEQWAQGKQEVEIIDMILKLKQKLNLYSEKLVNESPATGSSNTGTSATTYSTTNTLDQLRAQINCMKELLPNDLKNVINL